MSKPYSGIPLDEKRTWVVPRWLKEAFVAFALVAVALVVVAKLAQHFGGRVDRAKSAVEADDVEPRPAPPLKLPQRGGGTLDLSAYRGKPVLLNFWATWCPPCVEEMPSLKSLARAYDAGSFVVVTVSEDEGWDPVNRFLGQEAPFPVAIDEGHKVANSYGTSVYPESYLIDASGTVRLKFVGPRDWSDANIATLVESYGARKATRG